MFVNNKAFLHTLDVRIKTLSLVFFGTKKKGENYNKNVLYVGINELLRVYNKPGIYIKTIHVDHEFKPLFNDLEDK